MRKVYIEDLIEYDLGLNEGYIESLSLRANSSYHQVMLKGKKIDIPFQELKLVQCWISDFLRKLSANIPSYVAAYEKGRSIQNNALIHCDNAHIMTMDISDFFHSCTESEVINTLRKIELRTDDRGNRKLEKDEIDLLVKLACKDGSLCIGAPSSPAFANRIMMPIDHEIISSLSGNISYSRYSDDITISSNDWIDYSSVEGIVATILKKHGFSLNGNKTHCLGKGDRRKVTGVYICPNGDLSIGAKRKRAIKEDLYKFLVSGVGDSRRILGMIYFAIQIEPSWVANLLRKYANYGLARNSGVIEALRRKC